MTITTGATTPEQAAAGYIVILNCKANATSRQVWAEIYVMDEGDRVLVNKTEVYQQAADAKAEAAAIINALLAPAIEAARHDDAGCAHELGICWIAENDDSAEVRADLEAMYSTGCPLHKYSWETPDGPPAPGCLCYGDMPAPVHADEPLIITAQPAGSGVWVSAVADDGEGDDVYARDVVPAHPVCVADSVAHMAKRFRLAGYPVRII